jgi:hypothetical protein
MGAKDLRIGNFVYLTDKEKVWEILDGYEIDKCEENLFTQPIPLTEEWLVKFGFEFSEDESSEEKKVYFDNWNHDVIIRENIVKFYIVNTCETCYDVAIKYVHQLQNLYFALTGEELEIK